MDENPEDVRFRAPYVSSGHLGKGGPVQCALLLFAGQVEFKVEFVLSRYLGQPELCTSTYAILLRPLRDGEDVGGLQMQARIIKGIDT